MPPPENSAIARFKDCNPCPFPGVTYVLLTGHPPLHRVTIDFVGAAVPSGPSITGAPPWSPSSVMGFAHATFSPAGRRLWPFRRERSNVDGVPLIRHGCAVVGSFAALRMRRTPCGCFAMPPSPLRGEGYDRSDGSIQMPKAFPSSVTGCARATFPQGKAFRIHPAILKSDSTSRIKTTPFPRKTRPIPPETAKNQNLK